MKDRGVRLDVELGSKPVRAGVTRALRFWVMESSIEARDSRKKSSRVHQHGFQVALRLCDEHTTNRTKGKAKLRRKVRLLGRLRHRGLPLLRATHSFRRRSSAFPQNARHRVRNGRVWLIQVFQCCDAASWAVIVTIVAADMERLA